MERSQVVQSSPESVVIERPTLMSLRREMTWLISPDPLAERVMLRSGLVPASRDVSIMEHRHAHKSLKALAPIIQDIALATALASDVVTDTKVVTQEVDEEDFRATRLHNRGLIAQGAVGVLALLLDKGIIEIGSNRFSGE